jgi:site-specific recombinase XerD
MKKLLLDFKSYLIDKKLSKVSVKNYLSDIRRFNLWSAKNKKAGFKQEFFSQYKHYLYLKKTPVKTINRYLSSLRQFGQFLKAKKIVLKDPTQGLENIEAGNKARRPKKPQAQRVLLDKFKTSLVGQGLSPATIKNYLADINQFLSFLAKENQ